VLTVILRNTLYGVTPVAVHCPGRGRTHNARPWQLFKSFRERVKPSFTLPDDTSLITWNNGPEMSSDMERQCAEAGVPLTVLGRDGTPWSLVAKYELLRDFALSTDKPMVIAFDSQDVLIQGDLERCVKRLRELECEALFSAERNVFPDDLEMDHEIACFELKHYKRPWVHLNAGMFVARRSFLADLPTMPEEWRIDQRMWRYLQMRLWPMIRADDTCTVFQNINASPLAPDAPSGVTVQPQKVTR
jgi:hypothetical protein